MEETIAALVAHGLPLGDDWLDAGVDATLRALLGIELDVTEHRESGPSERRELTPDSPAAGAANAEDSSSPAAIASRLLAKLLRDRRVGGRHTSIDHVYGHHFADHEKDLARQVAEEMVRRGLLLPKRNETQFHVSINPRRLREVWTIIRMEQRTPWLMNDGDAR